MDWNKKIVSFKDKDQLIALQGHHIKDSSHSTALQGLLQCLASENTTCFCLEHQIIPNDMPQDLQHVLDQHASVFTARKGLPPQRAHDNSINLLPMNSTCECKFSFGLPSIDYLGHVISAQGVAMDPDKVKAELDWPVPVNAKEVRGFLGLTGYYHQFIKDYGKLAQPLTMLTKKEGFFWGQNQVKAFECLKQCLSSFPILTLPDFTKEFFIDCEASGQGFGAVLMQDCQPIAYFSKALSAGTLSKSVYEKEIMALALSIQHWQHYLLGRSFKVYTDHRSSKHLLQQRLTTTDQQCWLAKLMGFQFEVVLILVQRIRLIIPYPVSFLPLSSTPSPLVLIGWISLLSGTKCKMTLAWSS